MRKILLDGAWEGQRSSNGSIFPATVPGCVHTDLMKIGQLPGQRRTVSFTPTPGEAPDITCIGYTLA